MINPTGECFVPEASNVYEITVNIDRYLYAMQFCEGKTVIDAACGAGLGTYLYGLVAKDVYAVDYHREHLDNMLCFPHKESVHVLERNLDTDLLPECDVCVSLETIEHLEHPDFFLSQLKCKELVFSVPLFSLATSKFHKLDIQTESEVRELIERDFYITDMKNQEGKWIYGHAIKK
jgi:2-polyprenyl-3-methyl-5-hydroxy-6-metoxy-1,4-benzoquinol methylase